jgi:hypothetical protein
MTQDSHTRQQMRLYCCNGNPAPIPVVDGWKRFLAFSQTAKNNFLPLLMSSLLGTSGQHVDDMLDAFCQDHGLSAQDVVSAVQSCDFIIRQAATLDLSLEAFQHDLDALSGGDDAGAKIISAKYDEIKAELRALIIQESLADHGNLLVGLDWRLDEITASDRGTQLNTVVVFLTLRYRAGNQIERITFQLSPEAMKELKRFTDRFGA